MGGSKPSPQKEVVSDTTNRTWRDEQSAAILLDAFRFLLILGCLALAYLGIEVLKILGYNTDHLKTLEDLHFWGYFAVLAALLLGLVWKVLARTFKE